MTARLDGDGAKFRFYTAIEAALLAWCSVSLAIGASLNIPNVVLYTITMTGILTILGLAMRHPIYRRLRSGSDDQAT